MSSMWVQTPHIIRLALSVIFLCCLVSHLSLDDVNVLSLCPFSFILAFILYFSITHLFVILCAAHGTLLCLWFPVQYHISLFFSYVLYSKYWYLQYSYNFDFSLSLPFIVCNPIENILNHVNLFEIWFNNSIVHQFCFFVSFTFTGRLSLVVCRVVLDRTS